MNDEYGLGALIDMFFDLEEQIFESLDQAIYELFNFHISEDKLFIGKLI